MQTDPAGLIPFLSSIPGAGPYLIYLPILATLCAAVATVWPRPAAGSALLPLYVAINWAALNFGAAKNASAPAAGATAAIAPVTNIKQGG